MLAAKDKPVVNVSVPEVCEPQRPQTVVPSSCSASTSTSSTTKAVTTTMITTTTTTTLTTTPPTPTSVPSTGIYSNSSTRCGARAMRKTPAFSINVPARDTVANHVQTGVSGSSCLSSTPGVSITSKSSCPMSPSREFNTHFSKASASPSCSPITGQSFGQVPNTPSGYHERKFGTSPFGASRLLPLLYLGNEGDASLPEELLHRNIRRVLNVAFDCKNQDLSTFGIEVLRVPLRDCGDEDIYSHFPRLCAWIHEGITRGEGVIIHCRLGVSRSATIAIAYLMTYGISQPTRVMTTQHRYRVTPIAEQKPQGQCRTCSRHGRCWHHYEDNAERINRGEFHTHPEESSLASSRLLEKQRLSSPLSSASSLIASTSSDFKFTDYNDVFTYVAMRREQISPNLGFAMQLRKLNVSHGFSDFFAEEMSPGPSDDYCCGTMSPNDSTNFEGRNDSVDGSEGVFDAMCEAITVAYLSSSSSKKCDPCPSSSNYRRRDRCVGDDGSNSSSENEDEEGPSCRAATSIHFKTDRYNKEVSPAVV